MANHLRGEIEIKGEERTWRIAFRTQECLLAERLYRDESGDRIGTMDLMRFAAIGQLVSIAVLARAGLSGYARLSDGDLDEVGQDEALAMIDDCGPADVADAMINAINAAWPKSKKGGSPSGSGKAKSRAQTNGG